MNPDENMWSRREILLTSVAGATAGSAVFAAKSVLAQQKASLVAGLVEQVPISPDDEMWLTADVLNVPLAPQVLVKPRIYEASIKTIRTSALYDAEKIAIRLEWANPEADSRIDGAESFRDAVAIEFPANPDDGIPHFAMGETNKPVTIYQWKADWQLARDQDVGDRYPGMVSDAYQFSGRPPNDIAGLTDYSEPDGDKAFHTSWYVGNPLGDPELQAQTPVEKLIAEGFGSITSMDAEGQDALGEGVWNEGVWSVVISLPRAQEQFTFEPELTIPLAFAAWDGANNERGGEKAVSTWYFLSLDEPLGNIAYIGPALAVAAAAAVQGCGLWLLRRRTTLKSKIEA